MKIPRFSGEENAFCLEVAAAHPDHEVALIMLFESAFECFPDREYLIMSMPPKIPMKKLSVYFSRVPPRPDGAFPYELYVMHKNTMLSKIKVEVATFHHEQQVRRLLSTIPNQYYIQHQFEIYLQEKESIFYAYVMLSGDQVVGFTSEYGYRLYNANGLTSFVSSSLRGDRRGLPQIPLRPLSDNQLEDAQDGHARRIREFDPISHLRSARQVLLEGDS